MVVSKEFTLKYMDGREEHYENYRYHERLTGNEKITRKGNMLYKDGNTFLKKGEDYWVEITKGQRLGSEFTLEFTDGSTEDFVGFGHFASLNNENKNIKTNVLIKFPIIFLNDVKSILFDTKAAILNTVLNKERAKLINERTKVIFTSIIKLPGIFNKLFILMIKIIVKIKIRIERITFIKNTEE